MVYVRLHWFVYKIMEISSLFSYSEMVYVRLDWFVYKVMEMSS